MESSTLKGHFQKVPLIKLITFQTFFDSLTNLSTSTPHYIDVQVLEIYYIITIFIMYQQRSVDLLLFCRD